jgi:CelD/BcsL family acetyltransferase involved in cellulose biosynthesis
LPSWLRRNVRRTASLLEHLGEVEWRLTAPSDADQALTSFFELHGRRWRARGESGVLADERTRAFHRLAAPRLLADGELELCVLRVGGEPVAASYTLTRSSSYLYLFGFDPALPRLSLGSALILRSIERAIGGRRARYEFLRGAERYKYDWRAVDSWTQVLRRQPLA